MAVPSLPGIGSGFPSISQSIANWRGVLDGLTGDLFARLRAALTLGQDTRLLQLETALASGTLVVERCRVREAVHAHEPLWADIDCVSTSASLALKALTGEAATLKLQLADGSWRHWHGHVVQTAQLGADGGLARYRLTLAAWTHWLLQRRDTRIFQDLNAQDIVSQVCAAYPQARFRFEVRQGGPVRAVTTQYRETDWAFAQRLMAQEGWSWRLEHEAGQHTLVIFDELADVPDVGSLRFGRTDIRGRDGLGEDTITAWSVGQQVGPNAMTLGAWDERQVSGVSANASALTPQGNVPTLEAYAGHGERRYADGRVTDSLHASSDVADARARAWMAAHDLGQRGAQAHSAVRTLSEGASFAITEHSLYDGGLDNRFKVIAITHEAANNLGAEAAQILQTTDLDQGSYRNQFSAVPFDVRLVPMPSMAPTAPGPQTAIVVTANGEPVTTDRDGRVRVQFAWQRGTAPLPGGLNAPDTHGGQSTGHAPGDASSGTWVRVAQGVVGPNWGAVFTPRAGSEVMIDWVDGDIDRPIIVGQLHNGQHDLPWPAGEDSGANHIGAISGWHLPHLDGQGASQWLVDDSQGQLRMRLATYGAMGQGGWSELTLGHIIAHSGQGGSGQAQRGAWLGEGFYGHTDGWAIVRAGQGLFLSTTARSAQGSSVQSTQMDAAEAVAQLKAAQQLGQALSQSAQQQGAQALHSFEAQAQQAVQSHCNAMCPTAQGKHEGSINGQEAKKADGRTLGDPVERFALPLIHLDTPVTAAFVTPANISLFSGQDTSVAVQGDVHLTAAHTVSSVSGQTTSLYTHAGGIQAITANANASLQAHTDALQMWADQNVTIQSTTDEIRIYAKDSIALNAGQSQILLKGADITMTCPGQFTTKSATHAWEGPGQGGLTPLNLPSGTVNVSPQDLIIQRKYHDEEPLQGASYEARLSDGSVRKGVLDASGQAQLNGVPPGAAQVTFKPDQRAFERKHKEANDRANQTMDDIVSRHDQNKAGGAQ
ncbi:MAG: type VI secretion system tip protein VgrG [Burkholderiales bacterium]|nr:type VI secretion system tip protein VgrG [Burkholderiales bacterium]